MSVAVDPATVFGPRSILCASPLLPNFEEMARNECKSQIQNHFQITMETKAYLAELRTVCNMRQGFYYLGYNLTNQISLNI